MSARASKPCKARPEFEAMIEKIRNAEPGDVVGPFASSEEMQNAAREAKSREPKRVSLTEEVAFEMARELYPGEPPDIDKLAEAAVRVVLAKQSNLEAVARNVLKNLPAEPSRLTRDQLIHLIEMTRRLLISATES